MEWGKGQVREQLVHLLKGGEGTIVRLWLIHYNSVTRRAMNTSSAGWSSWLCFGVLLHYGLDLPPVDYFRYSIQRLSMYDESAEYFQHFRANTTHLKLLKLCNCKCRFSTSGSVDKVVKLNFWHTICGYLSTIILLRSNPQALVL